MWNLITEADLTISTVTVISFHDSRRELYIQSLSHLLLSDVIMPEMNGRNLADLLLAIQPEMKILFMSGYTSNIIASQGVLDERFHPKAFLHNRTSPQSQDGVMKTRPVI